MRVVVRVCVSPIILIRFFSSYRYGTDVITVNAHVAVFHAETMGSGSQLCPGLIGWYTLKAQGILGRNDTYRTCVADGKGWLNRPGNGLNEVATFLFYSTERKVEEDPPQTC